MLSRLRRATITGALGALAVLSTAAAAHAQSPSPFPSGPSGGEEQPKHEGVAEAAPKTPGLLPTTPALPPPKSRRKKLELLELDGYFRMRGDWFKNFNLGFSDDPAVGGAPFPRSIGCGATTSQVPCSGSIKSTNMRLRLEPTINLDETTSVHLQVDVLDNVVLGSTPDLGSGDVPLGAFSDGQTAPQAGVNDAKDSITVKRAWAEVGTPLGLLKFGRMPNHWGMGVMANGGGEDPISGTYDLDANYGDTVDRAMFSALIPGTRLKGAIATDWPVTRLASSQSSTGDRRGGQPWNLDNNDDVTQWTAVVSRMDTPTEFRDAVDRGELALNYGVYAAYRTQDWDYKSPATETVGGAPSPDAFVARGYKTYVGDAWGKAAWKQLQVEGEAVAVVGSIESIADAGTTNTGAVDVRQFGGVARLTYRAVEDKLKLGFEAGYASGDQWDNKPAGNINIANAQLLPGANDKTLQRFIFDRDYKVDLIFFRELMGAVSNAIYLRPNLSYALTSSITFKVQNVTSVAAKSISTPGNASLYGTEFDGDLGYNSDAFSAGLAYGVLFPLGALAHPSDAAYGFGTNIGDATTAHTIQARFVLKF